MKLIIHTGNRFLSKENSYSSFILHAFYGLCERKSADTFIFLTDDNKGTLPVNGRRIVGRNSFFSGVMKRAANSRMVNKVIREFGADILISFDGRPLRAPVSQILVVPEKLGRITGLKMANHVGNKPSPCCIVTPSEPIKRRLLSQGVKDTAILVLPQSPGRRFQVYDWDKKEAVKQKFAQGKEYFLMPVSGLSPEQMVPALKAFSQFKKWQQSNMQFVMVGKTTHHSKIQELLESYKYREDVKIWDIGTTNPEYPEILSSGMAMVVFPDEHSSDVIINEALQCGVPVIVVSKTLPEEKYGEAILLCDPSDIQDLAGQMVRLYKDEKFRSTLIEKGKEWIIPLSEENIQDRLWNYIQQTVSP